MKKSLLIILFFTFALLFPALALSDINSQSSDNTKKNILYINSYHDGYQWSDAILSGIRDQLNQSAFKIDLQIEYMDAKKFNVEPVIADLLILYKEKFHNEKFDVVLVSDDDAFNFTLKYRDQIFPNSPIVFCGVNDLDTDELQQGNVTGVVENFDLSGTIDVALKLHPNTKRMIVVGDDSTAGRAIKQQIEELVPAYRDRLYVDYWIQLDLAEVQNRVRLLPEDTFLFFIPYYQVIGSRFYTAEEVMQAIYSHSSVPLYTAWEFLLGNGVVGGNLLSGFTHGQEAASMALAILSGASADTIPVSYKPKSIYGFDYQVMQRLKIPESELPEGSQIINAPNPFYELPRELFWTIIVSFILLFITVIFLIINMIARKQTDQKMKNQLTFQQTLIDTIPQLVSWKDTQRRYVGANLTFANFFGVNEVSEVVNKTTESVVEDQEYVSWSIQADLDVVTETNAYRKVRKKIVSQEGEEAWLEVNKVPLKDQNGKISGILTTAENVTKEHSLEKQLLQSQKMEAIGTLASGIAHDFNNILTSIINSTELAIGDVDKKSQTGQDLERVLKAAHRGGRVVKQILTFSKPTQEGFRPTNLGTVVSEVIHLMEVSLPGNIIMHSHITPDIGLVNADPTQIHQAVMNLFTNAFHELREKGGSLHLRLEEETLSTEEAEYINLASGRYIKITVEDNGPGIAPEIMDKIFDPFFTLKDKSEGTGLGLAVVLGIIKGHGGGVKVKSEVGLGTKFELFLPKTEILAQHFETVESISNKGGGNILFVEDDEDQLLTVPRLLGEIGYDVEALDDSEAAAKLVASQPDYFDLLITDYDMPGLNGIELAEKINRWAPDLPVLMISGREEAVNASVGVDSIKRVFIKPYNKQELYTIILQVLQTR